MALIIEGLDTCPCHKTACKRHGNCFSCLVNHNPITKPDNPFVWCRRPENQPRLQELIEEARQRREAQAAAGPNPEG